MKKLRVKPWLNKDGSVKNDAELREALQQCPPSVWREYLATCEVRRQEDVVLPPAEIDEFSAEECAEMLFSMAVEEKHHLLKLSINASIRGLAPRQREVIVGHFWDGKTVAEMAASMGVSQQSVRKTMKTALLKLKASLTSGALRKRNHCDRSKAASSLRLSKLPVRCRGS